MYEFHSDAIPSNAVNRRWLLAEQAAWSPYFHPQSIVDPLTRNLAVYLERIRYRVGRPASVAEAAQKRFALTHRAYRLHEVGGVQSLELQGRVLAGQPLPAIATIMKLPVPVVQRYLLLFFDVDQSLLRARDLMLLQAVRPETVLCIQPHGLATVVKSMALAGGLTALEAIVPTLELCLNRHAEPDLVTEMGRHRERQRIQLLMLAIMEDQTCPGGVIDLVEKDLARCDLARRKLNSAQRHSQILEKHLHEVTQPAAKPLNPREGQTKVEPQPVQKPRLRVAG